MVIYVIQKNGGNKNSPYYLNVMVNYHYHSENRIISYLTGLSPHAFKQSTKTIHGVINGKVRKQAQNKFKRVK